ncbi:hypothetical protein E2542_SST19860 [Spatholobus suberectus]|nr:hypothetical protein E2542_SST19860 [Spatholobus suberectus]
MGLHMVALAKLHLQVTSHGLRPAVVGFACPLVLKFFMGFRFLRDDALYHSRLFLFQLGQIAFNREAQLSNVARMERALRLIWRTLTPAPATSSEDSQIGQEDTLHQLSMLAL